MAPQLIVTLLNEPAPAERAAFESRLYDVIGSYFDEREDREYRFYLTHLIHSDGKLHDSAQRLFHRVDQVLGGTATVILVDLGKKEIT